MDKVPMTSVGEAQLRQELRQLKNEARPRVVTAIAEARAHGDLKENAEYHAAKEQQGFIEGRIAEIEGKLSRRQVIDPALLPEQDKVVFGAVVTFVNVEDDTRMICQIVGRDEASIKNRKLSYDSPVARASIGKQVGDTVEVRTPKGLVVYEIEKVTYRDAKGT